MMNIQNADSIVFFAEGGIGKVIMATVPIRNIKKAYPNKRLTVVSGYPDILTNNPYVDRAYNFNNPLYFYDDVISGKNPAIIKSEPYLHYDYINNKRHLTDCWCELAGVFFDDPKPDLFLTEKEKKLAESFLKSTDKPTMLVQVTGGRNPPTTKSEDQIRVEMSMFTRNLKFETAQEVVDKFKDDYQILQIKGDKQPALNNTKPMTAPLRAILALIPYSEKFFLIDSFMQHAVAAFEKKAVVVWASTSPTQAGYSTNVNLSHEVCISPFCHRPNSFLLDIQQSGPWQCPFGEVCTVYKTQEIIDALNI